MPYLSYTPVSQRSMKSHKIISVPLSHPHTLENPSKFLALWKLSWRDQFIAGFRAQPNAITDFKNVCERRIKGKHMENVQYAWFQLQQKPREPGQLFVMFFCFSQKHKFGKKPSALRRFMVMGTNKLLFKKWHLRHCCLPENLKHVKSPNLLEAPFCLLKSLHLCLLRCSWHPHAEPCIRSVSAPSYQQSAPHLFLAFVSW